MIQYKYSYYNLIGVRVYPPAYFGDDASGPILMNNLACLGSEQNLYQCNQDRGTSYAASHSNDATIWCWTKSEYFVIIIPFLSYLFQMVIHVLIMLSG